MIVYYIGAALLFAGLADEKRAYFSRLQRDAAWATYPVSHAESNGKNNGSVLLRRGLRYYKTLIAVFPTSSLAHGLLGYCYYYLGKQEKAVDAFLMAAKKEPRFYWHQYNLAVIYYNRKDYGRAAEYFRKVAAQESDYLLVSTVYSPLLGLPEAVRGNLFRMAANFAAKTYGDAQKYLVTSMVRLRNKPSDQSPEELELTIHPWVEYIPVGLELISPKASLDIDHVKH